MPFRPALALAAVAATALGSCTPTRDVAPAARVVHVSDGDTLVVESDGVRETVRVLGIDAPEVAHNGTPAACGGDAATAELRRITAAGPVEVARHGKDRYGRTLADLTVGGHDVALAMVDAGRAGAWWPRSGTVPDDAGALLDAERHAKAERRGSWTTCAQLGRQR